MLDQLAPWEIAALFEPPAVTVITATVNGQQLAAPNGRRWLLAFAMNISMGGGTISPSRSVTGGDGIVLNTTTLPLVMRADEWGSLVQAAWFAGITVPNQLSLTVIELTMISWPRDGASKIILPWQDEERQNQERAQSAARQRAVRMRQVLDQCGIVSPRWLDNGSA